MAKASEREKERSKPPVFDALKMPPLDLNQRYSAPEASAYLRQCLATTRKQISDGTLESFTDGSRRYISGKAIAARSHHGI